MRRSTRWPERCRRTAAAMTCRPDRARCSSHQPPRRLRHHRTYQGLSLVATRRRFQSATTRVTISLIASRELRDRDDFKEVRPLLAARSKTTMTSQLRRHTVPAECRPTTKGWTSFSRQTKATKSWIVRSEISTFCWLRAKKFLPLFTSKKLGLVSPTDVKGVQRIRSNNYRPGTTVFA